MIRIEFDTLAELEDFAKIIGNNPLFESPFGESPVEAEDEAEIVETHSTIGAEVEVEIEDSKLDLDSIFESPKIPYNQRYRYDLYRMYFKTPKARGGRILLTGSEALDIVPLIQQGKGARSIWNAIGEFEHDEVTLSTLETFIRRYKEGRLDDALTFYCNNSRVNEDPSKYVYKGGR